MQKRKRGMYASADPVQRDLQATTALTISPSQPATPPIPTHPSGRAPITWESALAAWQGKLASDTTRATYSAAVRSFFAVPGAPDLASHELVAALDAYAGALRMRAESGASGQRLAPATVNLKLSGLRSFLGFARKRAWLAPHITSEVIADALQGMRSTVKRPYQIVEGADELRAMLEAAAADDWDAPRAVALVALGLGAGLRIAELVALDVGDLASDASGVFVDVRSGKGRKDRQVPISQDVYECVAEYLSATHRAVHRTADRSMPLFTSWASNRLTARQARRVISACAERAGFDKEGKRITPHGLRHSYAIALLMGDPEQGRPGAPLPAVSKLLGHSSVAVTGRYLNHFERRDLARYAPTLRQAQASN